ncbi:hypothetical protein KEM52_003307 [Ascosphaera acerosa]|nr:hypothetical protein KEM52_003307 [Ascosphaera acerosa]
MAAQPDPPRKRKRKRTRPRHDAAIAQIVAQSELPALLTPALSRRVERWRAQDDGGIEYGLQVHDNGSIPPALFDACLRLIEATSADAYRASSVGWNAAAKRAEMKDGDMRFLLVVRRARSGTGLSGTPTAQGSGGGENENEDEDALLGGFVSFMATQEAGRPVLYVYEIHLRPALRSRGVGRRLLQLVDQIAVRLRLAKVMLTAFRSNARGLRFYRRIGFAEDEASPPPRRLRGGRLRYRDYIIMSREPSGGDEAVQQDDTHDAVQQDDTDDAAQQDDTDDAAQQDDTDDAAQQDR